MNTFKDDFQHIMNSNFAKSRTMDRQAAACTCSCCVADRKSGSKIKVLVECTRIWGDDRDIEGVWSFLTFIDLYSTYMQIWRVHKKFYLVLEKKNEAIKRKND